MRRERRIDPGDQFGRQRGGKNTKLHAVTDGDGRPIRFFMAAAQVRSYTGAAALLRSLPNAERLLIDRGGDADWFKDALNDKEITLCILGLKSRGKPLKHNRCRFKGRNKIEIMFGGLKTWRRVATRNDRCPIVFLSAIAIALAATVVIWR